MAKSKPHLMAAITWSIKLAGAGALVSTAVFLRYASTEHQVFGMALARLAVGAGLMMPVYLFLLLRESQITIRELLHTIQSSALAAATAALSVWTLNATGLLSATKPWVNLAGDVIVGGAAAVGTLLVADREVSRRVLDLARGRLRLARGGGKVSGYAPIVTSAQADGEL